MKRFVARAPHLHRKMIDEAQPTARMLEEHVQPLLERFATPMMEHILRLERRINGQRNRIVRIRNAGGRSTGAISATDAIFASAAATGGATVTDGTDAAAAFAGTETATMTSATH